MIGRSYKRRGESGVFGGKVIFRDRVGGGS